jgi:hypothetical protein
MRDNAAVVPSVWSDGNASALALKSSRSDIHVLNQPAWELEYDCTSDPSM